MEILFYGDKQRMNKLYFSLVIMAIVLNYLLVEYLKEFNVFIPIMVILLAFFLLSYLRQMIRIYSGKNFIKFLKCDVSRIKGFVIFLALIFMGKSISLMNENAIILFNYDFLFIQRSIAICLFVVSIMNVDVMSKIIPIYFKKEPQVNEIEKKEIYFSRKSVDQSILNFNDFFNKQENNLNKYLATKKENAKCLNLGNTGNKEELMQLFYFLEKEKLIIDTISLEHFMRDFLRVPMILNFTVPAFRDFYNKFYLFNSHLKLLKPNEFTKLFINAKTGEPYKLNQFSKHQRPESRQYEKIFEFFASLKKKRSI